MSKNSETYIVSAKTVDEAMAIAQREYGGAGKDISFDILEMPKKGFFGFGARDAKIKVTVTEEETIDLSSIVAEMKSQRLREERSGKNESRADSKQRPEQRQPKQENKPAAKAEQKPEPRQPKQDRPVAKETPKQDKPVAKETQKQEKPVAKETPKQDKPVAKETQKQDKPVAKETPKQDRPVAKETPKQEKPVAKETPKQDKPVAKEAPKQDRPVAKEAPKQDKPVAKETPKQDKPAQPDKPVVKEAPKTEQPAPKSVEKPQHKESQASGILDNMPAYKVKDEGSNTPVYKETGANVKTYEKRPMSTGAVADGSLPGTNAPVTDVRWDSSRDLKKAAEATAAAMAAVSAKAAPVQEKPAKSRSYADASTVIDALEEKANTPAVVRAAVLTDEKELAREEEERYIPSDGSIDVDALNAAIDAMVEDLPAPENRKKVGVTQAEMEHAVAFVNTLLKNMQIQATAYAMPCPEGEEYETSEGADVYPAVEIAGEGAGILIGHHGETMDAIQYLLNLAAIRHSDNPAGDYVKITLDIENYRAKREETLRSLARRMANRALKYKRNVFLEPMNAYERRIIHSELQSVENVSTHSVGTDKNRKIVITYEGPDKVMEKPRSRSFEEGGRRNDRRNSDRRDRKRRDNQKSENGAEVSVAEVTTEMAAEGGEKPQQNRSKNRNRNRNRRGRKPNDGTDAATTTVEGNEEAPVTPGAAAILSAAEREEIDRQLSDPKSGSDRSRPAPKPVDPSEIPEFLRQPVIEQAEHLREN